MSERSCGSSPLPGSGVALSCHGIGKVFPVSKNGQVLSILRGKPYLGKTIHALRDVDISVPKGKILGILGRNGAGKSTLLRVLGGVYTPTTGKIFVDGNLTGLFELGGLGNRYLTGREYARRSLALQNVPHADVDSLIDEIRDFSELDRAFDRRIHTYSTGMAMRLYFASATALQYDIYLIDELLAVGDEHFQAKCWSRLRERLITGASGVLVTHDWSAVIKLCEQSCILDKGHIVESGPSDKVVASYLDIERPPATVARFASEQRKHFATAGRDMELTVGVELLKAKPVALGFSIEILRIGLGWEILLLGNNHYIADSVGQYDVTLRIRNSPLPAGTYSLNLFLSAAFGEVSTGNEPYDINSWTVGSGLELVVNGTETPEQSFNLPVEWEWR